MARTHILPEAQLDRLILQSSRETGVRPGLLRALIQQESGGNTLAESGAGAEGLTQLMPGTARGLGVKNPFNAAQSILGGAKYLADQLRAFGGDEGKALAAYNAGPGAVKKYGGIPPFAETQNYVKNVMALEAQYANLNKGQPTSMPASTDMQGLPQGPQATQTPAGNPGLRSAIDLFQHASGLSAALQRLGGASANIGNQLAQPLALPQSLTQAASGIMPGQTPAPAGPTQDGTPPKPAEALPNYGVKYTGQPLAGIKGGFLEAVSQAVAAAGGTIIDVISGYRSPQHNAEVGGVPHSNHMTGDAMDGRAFIPGKGWIPLGVLLQKNSYGIRSGNAPGFYNGQPDPNHVDDASNQH